PVVGNGAKAVAREEEQLLVPRIGVEGPAVAEDDGLARPPVLIEDLRAVFGFDRGHEGPPRVVRCRVGQRPGPVAGASRGPAQSCRHASDTSWIKVPRRRSPSSSGPSSLTAAPAYFFDAVWSSAARRPRASCTASSFAQKCMKKSLGSSSSMW